MSSSGLTFLQIINRVLARLREASVAANNTTIYSTFIGTLVNQVKSEIEDAYYWNALRDTYSVSAVLGTTSYSFTGSGANAILIDGWNTTTQTELTRGTNSDFNSKFFAVTSVQTGYVEQYLQAGLSADYDIKADIWPSPASTNALKFTIYKPQADLSNDTDIALVPQTVLIEEVIARAMVERGDDGAPAPQPGSTFIRVEALQSAISRESALDDGETDWEPD